ncbi:MAG: Uma2 family endonuclease, partial [Ardenticatenales bacterium]
TGAATGAATDAPIVNDPVLLTVRRRITADDYHTMADVGLIGPDERTELLDGEVVTKMTINSLHAGCVNRLNGLLGALLAGRAIVSVQNPVRLDDHSEPEPDVAVLAPRDDFYGRSHAHPGDVVWLVEVSDTSRRLDRDVKIPLYAASRIPEVWLVDLAAATIEVHRDPDAAGYRLVQRFGRGDVLHPAAFPDLAVAVDAILGPADDGPATTDA